jgi:hypothetical protein
MLAGPPAAASASQVRVSTGRLHPAREHQRLYPGIKQRQYALIA